MAVERLAAFLVAAVEGLAALLTEHPFADGDVLVSTSNLDVTAGELRADAERLAHRLREIGVADGQAVVVELPNGPGFITAMFGIWLAQAVFVPTNSRQPRAELERVVAATAPAAIIDGDGVRATGVEPTRYEGDVAFVTWTSGTTGQPRPILQSHSGYLELLDRVLGPLRGKPADPDRRPSPNLVPVSLALNAGIYNVLFGLRAGAPLVVMDKFQPRNSPSSSLDSPYAPPSFPRRRSSCWPMTRRSSIWRRCGTCAASRPPCRPWRPGASPRSSASPCSTGTGRPRSARSSVGRRPTPGSTPEKVGAVGRPHPGVAIKVLSGEGVEVPRGTVGELLVRPPRMAAGYADGDNLDDRLDGDGYVRTGDYARVDDGGLRVDRGSGGRRDQPRGQQGLSADRSKRCCASLRTCSEAAVVGVPDDRLGEVPVAFVVGTAPAEDLRRLCREHLVAYKVPVAFHQIDALPRSEIGKVLRRDLIARLSHAV